ncbi:peptide-methionine (S)-S-oxide reductase MsrA [Salinisphaera sp. RV14]|uniref:peptide-methionine (S)-S-oxide reductase MsrA n=1 Tax=unclassified Salinisphaera TaxID=2649847 RepID=UPI003F85C2AD
MAVATCAMGCLWKPEPIFRRIHGVADTAVGCAGGDLPNPFDPQLCAGATGQAEVAQASYDPERFGYTAGRDVFWQHRDPHPRARQGADVGRPYRSAMFTHGDAERAAARASRDVYPTQRTRPVVTEIEPLRALYRVEDYHQRFMEKTATLCL